MTHVVEYSSPESSISHERREIGGGGGGRDLSAKRHRRRRLFHDDDNESVVPSIIRRTRHSHVRRVRRRIDTVHGITEERASKDSTVTPEKPSEHSFVVVSPTTAADSTTATTPQPTTTQTKTTPTRTVIRLVVGGGTFSLTLHPRIRGRKSNDSNRRFCMASSTCCAATVVANAAPPPQRRPRPPWQRSAEVRYGDSMAWCDYHCLDEDPAAYVSIDDAAVREWVAWIVTSLLDPAMARLLPRITPLVVPSSYDSFQRVLDEWRRIVVATLIDIVSGYVRPRFHDVRLAVTMTAIYGAVWNHGVRPVLIAWISAAAAADSTTDAVAVATAAVDVHGPYTDGWLDHVKKTSGGGGGGPRSDGPPTTCSLDYVVRVHEDLLEWRAARECVIRLGELGAFLARRRFPCDDWTDVARNLSRDTGGFRDDAEERESCPATQRSIRAVAEREMDDDESGVGSFRNDVGPCRPPGWMVAYEFS